MSSASSDIIPAGQGTGQQIQFAAPDTSHLCEHCKSLQFKIKALCAGQKEVRIQSWKTIIASAPTCALCELILESRSPRWYEEFSPTDDALEIYSLSLSSNGLHTLFIRHPTNNMQEQFSLLAKADSAPAIAGYVAGRHIGPAFDLLCAKRWLRDCLDNHDHSPKKSGPRPRRLIAVGSEDGALPFRLVDGTAIKDEYFALSHCWGKGLPLKTTLKTLHDLQIAMSWNQLPRTFQDAIQITRQLGFHYIWIDALCIVQDDVADWDRESAIMGGIYNNATLTIMAAAAADNRGGCFRDRRSDKDAVALPYTDSTSATSLDIFAIRSPTVGESYYSDVENGPLFRRAWVLQERCLSKRKLIFGDTQLYWNCSRSFQSENMLIEMGDFGANKLPCRLFSEPHLGNHNENISVQLSWNSVVETYSSCSLSFDSDVLPALSGLANIFAQVTGYTYVAGLWLEEMPRSLLWEMATMLPQNYTTERCAPSWSWASKMGRCYHDWCADDKSELEVLQAHVKLASPDPYGKVLPGSRIVVKGRLRATMLTAETDPVTGGKFSLELGRDTLVSVTIDQDRDDLPLQVHILQITSPQQEYVLCRFLILEATSGGTDFKRIGIGSESVVLVDGATVFSGLEKTEVSLI